VFKNLFSKPINDSEIAEGQMKSIHLKGKSILLARVKGQIYAVSNICPHAGCHLHAGILTGYIVMCPCHGWKFDIRNGQFEGNMLVKLETYPSKTEQGKIIISI